MTDIKQLSYHLLSIKNPSSFYTPIHDQAFKLWFNGWKDEFKALNYDDSHLHDDFIRQDILSCICLLDQVIGVFLYSFFSLEAEAVRTFRYMKNNYTELFFQNLKKMGIQHVFAMQYLFVHPEWRGKSRKNDNGDIHLGLAFAGLTNRLRDEYGMDAVIGPTRADHKVTNLFYAFGTDCIVANVVNHNVPCDLIACIKGRTHPHESEKVREIEEYLWSTRIDTLDFTKSRVQNLKKSKAA